MPRNSQGWIKIYRSLVFDKDKYVNKDSHTFHLWITLLAMATYQNGELCKKGTLVTSHRELADLTGMTVPTVWRRLGALEKHEYIETLSETRGTTVTIRNWERYQAETEEGETLCETLATKEISHQRLKRLVHKKKVKKVKKDIPANFTDEDMKFAQAWSNEFGGAVEGSALEKWAVQTRLMRETDKFTREDFEDLFRFCRDSDFWRDKVISLPRLRKKTDGVMKARSILIQARTERSKPAKSKSTSFGLGNDIKERKQ